MLRTTQAGDTGALEEATLAWLEAEWVEVVEVEEVVEEELGLAPYPAQRMFTITNTSKLTRWLAGCSRWPWRRTVQGIGAVATRNMRSVKETTGETTETGEA